MTEEAAQLLKSSENVLETIRNGDWKEESAAEAAQRKRTFVGASSESGDDAKGGEKEEAEAEGSAAAADR